MGCAPSSCPAGSPSEQRCARWLLVSHDRSDGERLALTQEILAARLGVGASKATAVARSHRKAGLIGHHQDVMTVSDRRGWRRSHVSATRPTASASPSRSPC